MPAVLFHSPNDSPTEWKKKLRDFMPNLDMRIWPDIGDPNDIEFALVWKLPSGNYEKFKNLRCICSLGQGVDHIFTAADLPHQVHIMRLVDPWMAQAMSEWILLQVLRFHRQVPEYEDLEKQFKWKVLPPPETSKCAVGILGLGELGRDAARKISALGFKVAGWSRTEKEIEGVQCFYGEKQLEAFLNRTKILCCLLPLTPKTTGIINSKTISQLPRGSYIVNAGRGQHVVDKCLLRALDTGHLAGAALDVFNEEPLPSQHPYWAHPKVSVWPHVSAQSNAESAAGQVADAIGKVFSGKVPNNLVSRKQQY